MEFKCLLSICTVYLTYHFQAKQLLSEDEDDAGGREVDHEQDSEHDSELDEEDEEDDTANCQVGNGNPGHSRRRRQQQQRQGSEQPRRSPQGAQQDQQQQDGASSQQQLGSGQES